MSVGWEQGKEFRKDIVEKERYALEQRYGEEKVASDSFPEQKGLEIEWYIS